MRRFIVVLCCLAAALWTPVSVEARTCDSICNTTDLWGTSSKETGYQLCECTDSTTGAERTGPDCGCGVCYYKYGTKIVGQARVNGSCPSGTTGCDDCDIASSSSSSSSTTTPAPTSTTPSTTNSSSSSLTPSSTSASGTSGDSTGNNRSLNATSSPTTVPAVSNVTASMNSSHGSLNGAVDSPGGNVGSPSGSSNSGSSSKSSSGLATWQIVLIICSVVVVIAVVMITITSCYCKARKRMKDNELIEEDTREYEHYWHPSNDKEDLAENHLSISGFGAALAQGGRSSSFNSTQSRPNSSKNVAYDPTFSTMDERIGAGRSNRGSLGSNGDLPGIYQPFQRERPSQELGSRKNISIEL